MEERVVELLTEADRELESLLENNSSISNKKERKKTIHENFEYILEGLFKNGVKMITVNYFLIIIHLEM